MSTAHQERTDVGLTEGSVPRRVRYDIRIRTAVIPALVASLPVRATAVVVPRGAVYRLRVLAHHNIADIVRRLGESGLDVLEVRAQPPLSSTELTSPLPVAGRTDVVARPTGARDPRDSPRPDEGADPGS